jgi:hypothetical protein
VAVDRTRRDALADALAAYLRGEMDPGAVRDRVAIACDGPTRGGADVYLQELLEDLRFLPGSMQRWQWECVCRELAFLRTDFETNRAREPQPDGGEPDFDIPLAGWYLLGLAVAIALQPVAGWWPLATVWVLTFIPFLVQTWWHEAAVNKALVAAALRRRACEPFASEAEWLAHAGLLAPFRIPAYDPQVHDRSRLWMTPKRVRNAVAPVLGEIVIRCCQASTVWMWPLLLIRLTLTGSLADDDRG